MPTLWACGIQGKWDYLAIDYLGPSLDNLFRDSKLECMDLRSVLCIAIQVVSIHFYLSGDAVDSRFYWRR
jgi:casein kinase 1